MSIIKRHYMLFDSHTHAMKLIKHLKSCKIKHTLSPTPRELSVCCGVCIIYEKSDRDVIDSIIDSNDLRVKSFEILEVKIKNFYA